MIRFVSPLFRAGLVIAVFSTLVGVAAAQAPIDLSPAAPPPPVVSTPAAPPPVEGFIGSPLYYQFLMDQQPAEDLAPLAYTPCVGGMAGSYPCNKVDLVSFLPLASMGGGAGNVVWGWKDPVTGKEYALFGRSNGTAFIDISTPTAPVYVGNLPSHTGTSSWRDIRVYQNHAYIVADNNGAHGMQVFDLTQLRSVTTPPMTFGETNWYNGVAGNFINNGHTIFINEDTGFAYVVGSASCSGGLHMIDIQNPISPTFAGCYRGTTASAYTHETQCLVYQGPDVAYQGREICFNSNGSSDRVHVVDVTNKVAPTLLYTITYSGAGYPHQTWLTDDHRYMLLNDELDETSFGHNTRTRIFDVSDLNAPTYVGAYDGPTAAIDHNLYIKDGLVYEANYRAGLRILDGAGISSGALTEVGYFDIFPSSNSASFSGAWMAYPYFDSGVIAISGIGEGLFLVKFMNESDFSFAANNPQHTVCSAVTLTNTLVIAGSTIGNVNLTALNVPTGSNVIFGTNPVTMAGNVVMTTTVTTATTPGNYAFSVQANNTIYTHTVPFSLNVVGGAPTTPTLQLPASGATDQTLAPTFVWGSVAGADTYQLEVATDGAFSNVVYSATLAGGTTFHSSSQLLAENTDYYWRVWANNLCGAGAMAAPRMFHTRTLPPVLLVDDDDAGFDARSAYTTTLTTLGLAYDVWTTNTGFRAPTAPRLVEPTAEILALYDAVIWFSGDAPTGSAGPDGSSETALANYLDGDNGCFLLSSQNYFQDSVTPFMQNYLGVDTMLANVSYTNVNGLNLFSPVGNLALSYPSANHSDQLSLGVGGTAAFFGLSNYAGVYKPAANYFTSFWAFPAEALPVAARNLAVYKVLNACGLPAIDPTPVSPTWWTYLAFIRNQ